VGSGFDGGACADCPGSKLVRGRWFRSAAFAGQFRASWTGDLVQPGSGSRRAADCAGFNQFGHKFVRGRLFRWPTVPLAQHFLPMERSSWFRSDQGFSVIFYNRVLSGARCRFNMRRDFITAGGLSGESRREWDARIVPCRLGVNSNVFALAEKGGRIRRRISTRPVVLARSRCQRGDGGSWSSLGSGVKRRVYPWLVAERGVGAASFDDSRWTMPVTSRPLEGTKLVSLRRANGSVYALRRLEEIWWRFPQCD